MSPTFSPDLIGDVQQMLRYQFMVHALEAGALIALVAGFIGYLVVLRRSTFASHAIAHTGFAGGAAAVLVGVLPVYGLLVFTSLAGTAIGVLGQRAAHRDLETGTVLAFMLGLGLLFVNLYRGGTADEVYSLLFGEILGISTSQVVITLEAFAAIVAVSLIVYRPLLFSALDEDVAEARGMPVFLLGLVFMVLIALVVSIAIQAVGVLLTFSLTVTPAAIAIRLSNRPLVAISLAMTIALLSTWAGLFIAFYEPYPVSFFITTITFGGYLAVRGAGWLSARYHRRSGRVTDAVPEAEPA